MFPFIQLHLRATSVEFSWKVWRFILRLRIKRIPSRNIYFILSLCNKVWRMANLFPTIITFPSLFSTRTHQIKSTRCDICSYYIEKFFANQTAHKSTVFNFNITFCASCYRNVQSPFRRMNVRELFCWWTGSGVSQQDMPVSSSIFRRKYCYFFLDSTIQIIYTRWVWTQCDRCARSEST